MTTILYGLSNCDTCRKARKWLDRFGVEHRFVDYRDERQPPDTLLAWRDALGGWDAMVNKSSTTWRNLPQARKARQQQGFSFGKWSASSCCSTWAC